MKKSTWVMEEFLCFALYFLQIFCYGQEISPEKKIDNLNKKTLEAYQKEDYKNALSYWSEAVKILEHHFPHKKDKLANAYNTLGTILDKINNFEKAYEYFQKALEIYDYYYHNQDHENIAHCYSNFGTLLLNLNELKRSLEYHTEALKMRRRLYKDQDNIKIADSYNNIGNTLIFLKDLNKAAYNYKLALEIKERIYQQDNQALISTYNNLAEFLRDSGKFREAIFYYYKAIQMGERLNKGQDSTGVATSYENLGKLFMDIGDVKNAIEYQNKALQMRKRLYNNDNHIDIAMSYNNLGILSENVGNLEQSLKFHTIALQIFKSLYKNMDHPDIAGSYLNIGDVLENIGSLEQDFKKLEESLFNCNEALQMYERIHQNQLHFNLVRAYNVIGKTLSRMNKNKKALEYFLKSLDMSEKISKGKDYSEVAAAYNNIGCAFYRLGRLDKALRYFTESLKSELHLPKQNYQDIANNYYNLAMIQKELGELEQSFQNYIKAMEMERNLFKNYALLGGSLYKQLQLLRRLSGHSFHGFFTVLSKRPQSKHVGFAYESLVFRKTVMQDILLRERQIAKENQNPQVREIYEEYQSTVQELANLAYRPMEGEKELDRYKNLTNQKESLEARLTKEIRDLVKIEPVSLSKIQEKLSHDTALWEWVKYYDYDKNEYYYGCFILRHSSLKFVVVSPANPLEEAVRNLLKKIKDDLKEYCSLYNHKGKEQAESFLQEQELKVWKKASELRKVLCSQDFISSWKESKSIILAPDGILHFFPWAMLAFQDKSGKRKYFAEEKDFVYCLSGASLLKNPNSLPEKPIYYGLSSPDFNLPIQEEKNLVAMWQKKTLDSIPKILAMDLGNTKIALKGQAQLFWPSLDASTQEAEMCSQWFQHAFPQSEIHISKKKEALEIVFKAMSQEAHWLHLSTHGFFLESEDSKEEKNILDSFTERRLVLKQGTHPLLLSGIVLAGANLPKPQEINMDDGYLTAQEIATLDLSKVHCAVFSCCDTGLGKSELATGFSGLKTALAAAGVNHSIITLWNVLEQQSGNQLSLFYSYVFQYKMPVTQAINKTQRSTLLISKFRHPCLWASFLCYSNSIQPQ